MGNQNKKAILKIKMNTISKIALTAILAYAVEGKRGARGTGKRQMGPFEEGTPFYRGKCILRSTPSATGRMTEGKIMLHQEYTEAGELEPTFMDARIRNANNDRFAIEQYWTNPYEVDASGTVPAAMKHFGDYRPNKRDVLKVFGLYVDDTALQGDKSIHGSFLAVRDAETNS